jgi:hypothetical protein
MKRLRKDLWSKLSLEEGKIQIVGGDELVKVVWSHNTTVSRSTGCTPFKLLFGDEAITPEEAKTWSIRTTASAEDEADYQTTKDTIEGTKL